MQETIHAATKPAQEAKEQAAPLAEETKTDNRFALITTLISIFWLATIVSANHNKVIHLVETRTSERIEFNLRDLLGRTPPLSPKIKLLAVDDATFAYLGGPSPSLMGWAKTLANIAAKKPRAILIDKMFAETPVDGAQTEEALGILRAITTPIYTGAFFAPHPLASREEIHLQPEAYDINQLMPKDATPAEREKSLGILLAKDNHFIYGHAKWFETLFSGVGHITYDDDGRVPPLIRINKNFILPQLGLMPFLHEMRLSDGKATIAGRPLPIDRDGMSYFNHRPPQYFSQNAKSMRYVIERALNGVPERNVTEGDIVLIVAHFTGGTDFHEGTPFGSIPGGYLVASMVDGGLSGGWLSKFAYSDVAIVIMCLVGILVGALSRPAAFWAISLAVSGGIFCVGILLFSFQSLIFPWLMPLTGFLVSGMIHFANQSIQSELKKIALKRDFYAEKARRLEEENKKILLEESLKLGKVVQDLLLPKHYHGSFSQYTYDMKYTPSHIMGGDWLYIWNVSPEEQRIFMGDVMGKGPSAAIPVAIIIGVLKECEIRGLDMHASFQKINQQMVDLFGCAITSTCAAIVLRKSGIIDIYNAGTPGWVITKDAGTALHSMRSNPLGICSDCSYALQSINLTGNAMVFTFTDGYLEGARAFRKLINKLDQIHAFQADSDTIHEILMSSGEGHRLVDDRSLLAIKVAS